MVQAGGVNPKGNPKTLVAAQPGNQNALRYGVYSERALAPRAEEIRDQLTAAFQPGPEHSFAVHEIARLAATIDEIARLAAIIDAIDRDLDERGLTDRNGKARYLVDSRLRYSRQLERLYDKLVTALAPRTPTRLAGERSDYVAELQRIALHDSSVGAADRVRALQVLLSLGWRGTTAGVLADERARSELPRGEFIGQTFTKREGDWTPEEGRSQ